MGRSVGIKKFRISSTGFCTGFRLLVLHDLAGFTGGGLAPGRCCWVNLWSCTGEGRLIVGIRDLGSCGARYWVML